MGQFTVPARLTGPTGRSETVPLLVDTGATFLALPRSIAERLELRTVRRQRVRVAGGRVTTWRVAEVRLQVGNSYTPALCFVMPRGPALLGAFALQSLLLAVDPVHERLVPVREAYV
jgi:predicted aspartyl protease